jgi:hypothetical protein
VCVRRAAYVHRVPSSTHSRRKATAVHYVSKVSGLRARVLYETVRTCVLLGGPLPVTGLQVARVPSVNAEGCTRPADLPGRSPSSLNRACHPEPEATCTSSRTMKWGQAASLCVSACLCSPWLALEVPGLLTAVCVLTDLHASPWAHRWLRSRQVLNN